LIKKRSRKDLPTETECTWNVHKTPFKVQHNVKARDQGTTENSHIAHCTRT